MKKNILLLFSIFIVIFFTQCKKMDNPSNSGMSFENLKVSANFDWKMTEKYSFTITGQSLQVIIVQTTDGTKRLYKCNIASGKSQISFDLSLPKYMKEVLVNDQKVSLSQGIINIALSPVKSTMTPNYYLAFNGTSSYVDMGDPASGDLDMGTGPFTLEAWVRSSDFSVNTWYRRIFGKGFKFSAYLDDATGKLGIYCNSTASSGFTTAVIADNAWHHIAIVRNGGQIDIYVDGILDYSEVNPAWAADLSSSENFTVGVLQNGGTMAGFWNGRINNVRLWDDALNAGYINSIMNKLLPSSTPHLIGDWWFNDGSGNIAEDHSVNHNHGTIHQCDWVAFPLSRDSDGDGIIDEDDDFPTDPLLAHSNFYPVSGTGTLVFEDLWPGKGDFDFNDLVLGYRFNILTDAEDHVAKITGTFTGRANGALQLNGFAFQLPDATFNTADVDVTGYGLHVPSFISLDGNGFEMGQSKPTVVVFENNYDYMDGYVNTQLGKPYVTPFEINVEMTVNSGTYITADFGIDTWNPFLIINLTRGYELHLKNHLPTDLVNPAYFGLADDASDPLTGTYYVTKTNIPWALDFPEYFDYVTEMANFTEAYLHFQAWAESDGTLYPDWYSNTGPGYRNNSIIYSH